VREDRTIGCNSFLSVIVKSSSAKFDSKHLPDEGCHDYAQCHERQSPPRFAETGHKAQPFDKHKQINNFQDNREHIPSGCHSLKKQIFIHSSYFEIGRISY